MQRSYSTVLLPAGIGDRSNASFMQASDSGSGSGSGVGVAQTELIKLHNKINGVRSVDVQSKTVTVLPDISES